MGRVYLSLGSNMGDKQLNLNKAIGLIKNSNNTDNIIVSSFYQTAPQGYVDQDSFVNCVVGLDTNLDPFEMLNFCQSIEKKLKRVRLFKWGPRIIDIDILLYDDLVIKTLDLIIPHERMFERAFVLVPLTEINSNYKIEDYSVGDQEVLKI